MPLIPSALSSLIQSNVNTNMKAAINFEPLSSKNPAYFIEMCTAIGTGIATGSPVISFTTSDSGFTGIPPIPGVGSGLGIVMNGSFFVQDLYTRIRDYTIADFGVTMHDAYPPRVGNSGQVLLAICKGISDAVVAQFATAWTLTSAHPLIYAGSGTISDGSFTGLIAPTIQNLITTGAPDFKGKFWPRLTQAVSESYVAAVEQHSAGTVTIIGICVVAPTQLCAIPSVGTGAGTAI